MHGSPTFRRALTSSLAPSERAMADDTPPPIAPPDMVIISMTKGNTSAIAASDSVPRRPIYVVSAITTQCAGAERHDIRRMRAATASAGFFRQVRDWTAGAAISGERRLTITREPGWMIGGSATPMIGHTSRLLLHRPGRDRRASRHQILASILMASPRASDAGRVCAYALGLSFRDALAVGA